jgi:hypothetical protein
MILSNDTIIDGKAKITDNCMSFKRLGDIDLSLLQDAIRQALSLAQHSPIVIFFLRKTGCFWIPISLYKMKSIRLVLAAFFVLALSNCSKVDVPEDTPRAIKKIIREMQEESVSNPPSSVWEYTFEGRKVYYVPPKCCDISSTLYDSKGEELCHPDGGHFGVGDGACPSFFGSRSNERLIWKDNR